MRDMVFVALAGPATNILLAILSIALLPLSVHLPEIARQWAGQTLIASLGFNLIIAVFNMLPIPPLDGGRVAVGLLPRQLGMQLARLEPYGIFIVMGLFMIVPFALGARGQAFSPYIWLVRIPAAWLEGHLVMLFGLA